ncbi:site-specific integrase [Martelella sp. FLE1502]
MSVYKRSGEATYSYDFVVRGRRFSGKTGATSKREAKRVEDAIKESVRAELIAAETRPADRMTFEEAASRWWLEIGQHHKNVETTLQVLAWLNDAVGKNTDLAKIDDARIAAIVARRRGEHIKGDPKRPLVSAATVNRTCTQPLREIMLRAKNVWKVKTADFHFGQHLLKERQERVREASAAEEDRILSELSPGYAEAVLFAFLTGCRRMEILGLRWPHVDFFGRQFTVTGKGDRRRVIPMSQAIYDLLWSQKDHHPEIVFTYVARRTLKKRNLIKGRRYPLTEAGLKTAMRRAVPAAGVEDFRFHDTRHTAATRVLRKSNLRVAQRLLGHADIQTTTKYAHALDEDIRAALDATSSPTRNPTEADGIRDNDLKKQEK